MKWVFSMLTMLMLLAFSMPSFSSSGTTVYYMPVAAQVSADCEKGAACADVHVNEFSGITGVTHGLLDVGTMKTEGLDSKERKHYSVGVHFSHELVDGFTPFVGAGLYSGFDEGEHKVQLLDGDLTALANIGWF